MCGWVWAETISFSLLLHYITKNLFLFLQALGVSVCSPQTKQTNSIFLLSFLKPFSIPVTPIKLQISPINPNLIHEFYFRCSRFWFISCHMLPLKNKQVVDTCWSEWQIGNPNQQLTFLESGDLEFSLQIICSDLSPKEF